ncbi:MULTISPECIES: molecular chaperone [Serratia]|jgi:P pilus assembly chaperone PapD|nr:MULTISPECIES: fimbria/pilus periplasmic chaperone [Serratia]MCS4266096.1 P pilus assembly chaperone PapD [Serratia sp. BIGb0163]CAI0718791.1 Chaperone protein focC precursor [Serratia quinivorans]
MKALQVALYLGLILSSSLVQAGVVIGATRVVYDGGLRESSLSVSNPDKVPYLIQSWVDPQTAGSEKAPFILTPPLFRLEGGDKNVLRIVRLGGNLPKDRESLYWLNVKAIPSSENKDNTLQIAVNTRIKLIYRPEQLKDKSPEAVAGQLSWSRQGGKLRVNNPTPYYMNFQSVKIEGQEVRDATYVAPFSSADFALQEVKAGNAVSWIVINDFGGSGATQQGRLAG